MRSLKTLVAFVALGVGAIAAPPVLPRPAKELEIIEPSGKHDLLTSYRGKVLIVQFLYTTCPHCQAYSQLLTKLQAEYGPKGFQALGAAFNEADQKMVSGYINQYKVSFPIGPVSRDTVASYLGLSVMDEMWVPQIVLIDRKGQIREQTDAKPTGESPLQNEAHLRSAIEKLLAEGSAASKNAAPAKTGTPAASSSVKKSVSVN